MLHLVAISILRLLPIFYTDTTNPPPILKQLDRTILRIEDCEEGAQTIFYLPGADLYSTCITDLPNGNLMLCGAYNDASLFIEVDPNGRVQWAGVVDVYPLTPESITAATVDQEGYLIGQGQYRVGSSNNYVLRLNLTDRSLEWVIKPDASDVILWDIIDPGVTEDYIGIGVDRTAPAPGVGNDCIIRRIDRATGEIRLSHALNFNLGSADDFQTVFLHNNALYTCGRYTPTSSFGDMRIAVSKLDMQGNEVWSRLTVRPIDAEARMYGEDIVAKNGFIYFTGNGDPNGTSLDYWLSYLGMFNGNGELLWLKEIDILNLEAQFISDIKETDVGLLISCRGWRGEPMRGFVHLDDDGNVLSKGVLGNDGYEMGLFRFADQVVVNGDEFYNVYTTAAYTTNVGIAFTRHPLTGSPNTDCQSFNDLDILITDLDSPVNMIYDLEEYATMTPHTISNPAVQSITLADTVLCVCDSIPEIMGTLSTLPVDCPGDSTGALEFSLQDGTPPFMYSWESLSATLTGSGTVPDLNTVEWITGLAAGNYQVTVTDQNGMELILNDEITEPPAIMPDLTIIDYNGFNISCFGASDGQIEVMPTGGSGGFSFAWSNGASTPLISQLSAGLYTATVTDSESCTAEISVQLSQPLPLDLMVEGKSPDCDGPNTGQVNVLSTTGGVSPYQFRLNDDSFSDQATFGNLGAGDYLLTVLDANGCVADTMISLSSIEIPQINTGSDVTIAFGDSTVLDVTANIDLDSLLWMPANGLSCTSCPNPVASPEITTTYLVTVVSEDGCATTAAVTVFVDRERRIYYPNAFSPNGDGVNEFFTIVGDEQVSGIIELNVFSRWGEHLYRGAGLPANGVGVGWDGTFKGEQMQAGVYTWYATVGFADGETGKYKGTVTLIR